MANVVITNNTLVKNTVKEIAFVAATSNVASAAQILEFIPTKDDQSTTILISNTGFEVAFSVGVGDNEATKAGAALTGTIDAGKTAALQLESGKYLNGGKYLITFTPAEGKKLVDDHALTATMVDLA